MKRRRREIIYIQQEDISNNINGYTHAVSYTLQHYSHTKFYHMSVRARVCVCVCWMEMVYSSEDIANVRTSKKRGKTITIPIIRTKSVWRIK